MVKQAAKEVLGAHPCRVVVGRIKTGWASCNSKRTIMVNILAAHLPRALNLMHCLP